MSTSAPEFEPFVRAMPSSWTPEYCFRRLSQLPGCVWLDSSQALSHLGRYSYLAADPFVTLRIDKPHPEALESVARFCERFHQPALPGLPPFQGGWAGWFGYELGACFERLPTFRYNEFQLPLAALGLYDIVLAWDHQRGQSWIVSQGWPRTARNRQAQAYRRLQQVMALLESDSPFKDLKPFTATGTRPLAASRLAPQFPTRWSTTWTSNFSSDDFRAAVSTAVQYVHAGDIFQVNLAQRLLHKARCTAADLALHLRTTNPAPFAGYADFGRVQVVSTSPERFLNVQQGQIETRPIKGTRPRMSDPVADQGIAELLRSSPKDRSENVMIVDLLRNDLSRIADRDSIRVSQLCELEAYRYVWHLVSAIEARLAPGHTPIDVIKATFPGGSITGAPKIRAMEVIAELEPTSRGPYCGSLGYIGFSGNMDLNILIRTVTACEGWWQLPVGGGIVADSQPVLEEQETWHKAEGILRAIDQIVVL